VRLRFLGTRGEIESRSREHRQHSSLLVRYRRSGLLIDWGLDWRGRAVDPGATALLLTHAHPDHVGGIRDGCELSVYATEETRTALRRYPIEWRAVVPRRPFELGGLKVEAFRVAHSLRAPAVGYRIHAGRATVFYAPDVLAIEEQQEALEGVDLYVGDGAAITRSIVRRRVETLIGHAAIRVQLVWCEEEGVPRAVFTHCGSELVKGDPVRVAARVAELGAALGVEALVAHDGLELVVR
jgi:phosphoribosyl 1,2-cyclic phosphodiesterase